MNSGMIAASAAIFGSIVGALGSVVGTWITQRHQDMRDLLAKTNFPPVESLTERAKVGMRVVLIGHGYVLALAKRHLDPAFDTLIDESEAGNFFALPTAAPASHAAAVPVRPPIFAAAREKPPSIGSRVTGAQLFRLPRRKCLFLDAPIAGAWSGRAEDRGDPSPRLFGR